MAAGYPRSCPEGPCSRMGSGAPVPTRGRKAVGLMAAVLTAPPSVSPAAPTHKLTELRTPPSSPGPGASHDRTRVTVASGAPRYSRSMGRWESARDSKTEEWKLCD